MEILLEGKRIDSEYEKDWKEIDRDTFDQIISLDPTTNIDADRIGPSAKQLLLPSYINGETDFLNKKDEVTQCLSTYTKNRGQYPQPLRNIANFPSVSDFIDYILNGDESEFAKNHDLTSYEKSNQKEDKISAIYNKYYKDKLDRETFDKIISLDAETNDSAIGSVAKNLLLPKFISGENFLDDSEKVAQAIEAFEKDKSTYPADKRDVAKYESVKDFVTFVISGPESNFVTYLKEHLTDKQIKFLASTRTYDIIQPLCYEAAWRIVGKKSASDPKYDLQWCTGYYTSSHYWDTYSGYGPIVCFIWKNDPKNKDKCFQGNINKRSHEMSMFLNGHDRNPSGKSDAEYFESFLWANLDVLNAIKDLEVFKDNPSVIKCVRKLDAIQKTVEIRSTDDIDQLDIDDIKQVVPEVVIHLEKVPPVCFADCSGLKRVVFAEEVKKIGVQSFLNCIGLKEIVLPQGLEEIGAEAFAGCSSLTRTIKLPDSLTKIGREAFRGTHVTLSVNKARTQPLHVSLQDKSWYASHMKGINMQENFIEQKLDENIPPDLMRAYQNSMMPARGIQAHPNSEHSNIGANAKRRSVKYDYYNSTYEELSKQETIDYLGLKITIADERDENGKLIVKARTTDRELFNDRISTLRFIIDGKLVEYEVRNNNVLYLAYWTSIPGRYFGDYPLFSSKDSLTTDCRYATKYSDVYTIIMIADKIYKTDEYEHEITPTTLSGRKIKVARLNDDGTPALDDNGNPIYDIVDDTIQAKRDRAKRVSKMRSFVPSTDSRHELHQTAYNFGAEYESSEDDLEGTGDYYAANTNFMKYVPDTIDTGAHKSADKFNAVTKRKYYSGYQSYINALDAKAKAFKKYDYIRQGLKKLESERDLYDEDEYQQLYDSLLAEKNDAYKQYQAASLTVRKEKDKLLLKVDDLTIELNKRIKKVLTNTQKLKDREYSLYKDLTKLKGETIYDSAESSSKFKTLTHELESIRSEIEDYNMTKTRILAEITELQTQLQNNEISLTAALTQLTDAKEKVDQLADEEIEQKFKRMDEIQVEMDEIQKELDSMHRKPQASKDAPKSKEIDNSLQNILVFDNNDSAADELTNA